MVSEATKCIKENEGLSVENSHTSFVLVVTLKRDWVLSNVSCFTVQVDFQTCTLQVGFNN